jgi:hypothetical protein
VFPKACGGNVCIWRHFWHVFLQLWHFLISSTSFSSSNCMRMLSLLIFCLLLSSEKWRVSPLFPNLNFSLFLIKYHAMKKYWGSGGIAPSILDLSTRWRWVDSFMPRPLYTRGKCLRCSLVTRLSGYQSRSGRGGKEETAHLSPCRESNPGRLSSCIVTVRTEVTSPVIPYTDKPHARYLLNPPPPRRDLHIKTCRCAGPTGRAVWGPHGLSPPDLWHRGFESRSRYGCVSTFLCVLLSCVGRSLQMSWSPVLQFPSCSKISKIIQFQRLILKWNRPQGPIHETWNSHLLTFN